RPLHQPTSTLFPYTTLFRSQIDRGVSIDGCSRPTAAALFPKYESDTSAHYSGSTVDRKAAAIEVVNAGIEREVGARIDAHTATRSEEHTSELQSLRHLVCRL